jgi:hypothetical protein
MSLRDARIGLALALLLATLPGRARADEDAKAVFERATALFALHKFHDAALVFEKAFELRPDPAILYNAAQAHRLAGEKTRALDLYESLLRLYGDRFKRVEISQHIAELKHAIDADQRASGSPPVDTLPSEAVNKPTPRPVVASSTSPPPRPAPRAVTPERPAPRAVAPERAAPPPPPPPAPPPPAVEPAPASVVAPVAVEKQREPVTKKKWFWPVVGGGAALVVVAVTVGIVVGTSKTVPPTPTFGTVRGN